nr:MAG TPA: hypothetical protein [Caudoviricetes sp.]
MGLVLQHRLPYQAYTVDNIPIYQYVVIEPSRIIS